MLFLGGVEEQSARDTSSDNGCEPLLVASAASRDRGSVLGTRGALDSMSGVGEIPCGFCGQQPRVKDPGMPKLVGGLSGGHLQIVAWVAWLLTGHKGTNGAGGLIDAKFGANGGREAGLCAVASCEQDQFPIDVCSES
jgi:hypothetical protein